MHCFFVLEIFTIIKLPLKQYKCTLLCSVYLICKTAQHYEKRLFNLLKKGRHCNMMSRWAHFRLSVQAVAFYVHLCTAAINCSKNSAQCFSLNPTRSLLWPRPKYVQPNEKTKTDIFLSWTYWTTLDLSFTVTYKHCVPQHVRSGVVKCMHGCMGWDAAHWAEVEWGHRGRSSFLAANWKYENISLHSAFYCTGLFQVYHATLEWKHICYRQLPTLGRRATWEHLVSDVLKATLFWLNWR